MAAASRAVGVCAGELVFREGAACEGFYFVSAGSVRLYKIGPDGRERTLHIVRPPHAFAEAAVFGMGSYPAFATAIEDSRLVFVRRGPFLDMLRARPETALRVLESLSGWMHQLLDQLENETFLNARAKLANYLLRAAHKQHAGPGSARIELSVPKKDVASQLGMAPETLSRALADLEARGLISSCGRAIDLRDSEALEALLLGSAGSS